jgi:hypothetical protein
MMEAQQAPQNSSENDQIKNTTGIDQIKILNATAWPRRKGPGAVTGAS